MSRAAMAYKEAGSFSDTAVIDERFWGQSQLRANCARFGLTPRETDVAMLLADRLSCREIAERLGMSFNTARCHTERILSKLDLHRKRDVQKALYGGLRVGILT